MRTIEVIPDLELINNLTNEIKARCSPIEAACVLIALLYNLYRSGMSNASTFEEFVDDLANEAKRNADYMRKQLLRHTN